MKNHWFEFLQHGQPSGSIQVTPTLVAEETVPVIDQEEEGPPQQLQGNIFTHELQIEDTAQKEQSNDLFISFSL